MAEWMPPRVITFARPVAAAIDSPLSYGDIHPHPFRDACKFITLERAMIDLHYWTPNGHGITCFSKRPG
jgi:hypothetical protein